MRELNLSIGYTYWSKIDWLPTGSSVNVFLKSHGKVQHSKDLSSCANMQFVNRNETAECLEKNQRRTVLVK